MNKNKIIQVGKIAAQAREYAKKLIKKDMPLLEIAEKIEAKIEELGAKPAFPVNLSIDEVAAHYTPGPEDETKAHGLLNIDLGAHIDGWLSDTAFSIDLDNSEENKALIETAQEALKSAIEKTKSDTSLNEIGKTIQETIESKDFSPIVNLSGHSMDQYDLHSGITIPNTDNKNTNYIEDELVAIEPFVTLGDASGKVKDGKPSGIYFLQSKKPLRNPEARKVLTFIAEEYQSLPFCSRWVTKKFGKQALFSLKQLEDNGNLHHFPQLVESSGAKVSQAEHTLLIEKDNVIVTTA
tara:strand:+ start:321 stop:1205 length:885 start_codon:yes stop_codon:yes gene_type:complete